MNNSIIYLDHAAATPVDKQVCLAMKPYLADKFYNPASPYAPAQDVRRDYETAKQTIANLIGAKLDELIMTAGSTESINLAFTGIGGHIITTNIEHQAVLGAAKRHEHTLVDVDKYGSIKAEAIKSAIKTSTCLVSVALANNEIGTIQPLSEIAKVICKERQKRLSAGNATPIYLHSDASQAIGQIDVHVSRLGVNLLTLSAAKIYGPKQVGLLWADNLVQLKPQIVGGGQEHGLRSGTENVAGVIGFAKAMQSACTKRKVESRRLAVLQKQLKTQLLKAFPDIIFSGHPKKHLPGYLHVAFPGIDAERLVFALETRGVLVATGSACAANYGTRSHVLAAIGLSPEIINGSLRISLGHLSTPDNINQAGQTIIEEVRHERRRLQS